MKDYQGAVDRYIAAWNATTGEERTAAVARAFTESASYADPLTAAEGHARLDAMIGAVQQQFANMRFHLASRPDGHGDCLRFSWTLGPDAATPVARGSDFAVLADDGRLHQVRGFLDMLPQPA